MYPSFVMPSGWEMEAQSRNELQTTGLVYSYSLPVQELCLTVPTPCGRGCHSCECEGRGKLEQTEDEESHIQSA